ncbi:MAG TPA: hypothetical protein VMM76_17280 [Pirellulaceae bacterium]|nr:hypothetical protein [Pirellulaceae bacterium]
MTNVDGEFKFRLWIDKDYRNNFMGVPPSFAGHLYVGGQPSVTPTGEIRLLVGFSRRYPLLELKNVSDAANKE